MFQHVDARESVKEYDSSERITEIRDFVWDTGSLDTELFDLWSLIFLFVFP